MKKNLLFLLLAILPMVASADKVEIDGICYNLNAENKVAEVTSGGKYSGEVVIPSSVTYNDVEYSVTSIGQEAFSWCYSLTSITIPNSVTSIGYQAFYGCTSLTSITIPNSVTSIGGSAFSYCSSLTSITIPNSVTSIGGFYECTSLTSITIPNSVTSIRGDAFRGCSSLTSITIPNSVTSIGDFAFHNCSSLTSITIPNSVTFIGGWAFEGTAWYDNQPDGLVYAGKVAYKYKGDMPENTKIILNDGTLGISGSAFRGCSSLTSITIPNSVTSIGDDAFRGCSSLTSITIPNSVTSIGWEAFYGCSGLTSITIPNSVTSIRGSAFYYCSSLTSITIPNSVTSIVEQAFYGCSGLTSITIPNSVTSIGNSAFYECTSLTSITIGNSVTSIGSCAFSGCSNLTSITIGSGIKTINDHAFSSCSKLTDVYCYAVNVPRMWDSFYNKPITNAFDGSKVENATLHVPEESLQAYKETEPWSKFGTIVGLSGGTPVTPETPKCATPTISYDDDNKKLTFGCETEGVEYVYSIKDTDIKQGYDAEVTLTATYEISVYATKAGYENSDKATATLVWGSATFTDTTPATAIEMVPAMEAAMPVLIQNNGGMLTVQGAQDGTPVSVYTIAGTEAGSAVSQNSRATISTSMQQGDIAIVRIGNWSVKVVLK